MGAWGPAAVATVPDVIVWRRATDSNCTPGVDASRLAGEPCASQVHSPWQKTEVTIPTPVGACRFQSGAGPRPVRLPSGSPLWARTRNLPIQSGTHGQSCCRGMVGVRGIEPRSVG